MIASKFNSELHLLHVTHHADAADLTIPEAYFFEVAKDDKETEEFDKRSLIKIKKDLEQRFDVKIAIHEVMGKLCKTVRDFSHQLHIDLVVLGAVKKNWVKEVFFQSKVKNIIRAVDCEVLCVYPGSNSIRLKKIVLPIGKFVHKRKIRLAYELAKKFAANVHLISLNSNGTSLNSEETKVLMTSYQYLKDITNIPIECRTVQGDNLARATLDYAENIGADLILVNAGAESHFKNAVLTKWAGNIVNHSSIPVLCVHAINEETNRRQFRA
jgi:nucleotide-binding universal stress UspA family protein